MQGARRRGCHLTRVSVQDGVQHMIYRTGTLYLLPLSRGGDNGQPEQIAVSPVSDAFDLSPIDTLRSLIRSSHQ